MKWQACKQTPRLKDTTGVNVSPLIRAEIGRPSICPTGTGCPCGPESSTDELQHWQPQGRGLRGVRLGCCWSLPLAATLRGLLVTCFGEPKVARCGAARLPLQVPLVRLGRDRELKEARGTGHRALCQSPDLAWCYGATWCPKSSIRM